MYDVVEVWKRVGGVSETVISLVGRDSSISESVAALAVVTCNLKS
jgi:hypothetical protein